MADTTTANAPRHDQTAPDPPPEPHGHIVFTGHFDEDTRLRLFITCKQEQSVQNSKKCNSYCVRATKEHAEPNHMLTPSHVVEQHGSFRYIGAFQDICERVLNPNFERGLAPKRGRARGGETAGSQGRGGV